MRRVYYAFLLRLLSHAVVVHTAVITLSIFALSQVVSIPNIWANLMQVKVGEMVNFFIGALANTQLVVIVWLSLIALTIASLIVRLFRSNRFHVEMDREAEWV